MLKDLRFRLYKIIFDLLPFLSAFIIVVFPEDFLALKKPLLNYLIAIFLFISWKAVRTLFFHIREGIEVFWTHYISLALFALTTPAILQVLKSKIDPNVFYLVLIVMFAQLLTDLYERMRKADLAVASKFIFLLLSGLLSFAFLRLPINNAVLVFCLSLTFIYSAQYLSSIGRIEMITFGSLNEKFSDRFWSLVYSLFLVLAPLGILGMSTLGLLAFQYGLIVAVIPLMGSVIGKLNNNHSKNLDLKAFFLDTSSLSLFFIVIIILLRLY